jgi:hypothetical protein
MTYQSAEIIAVNAVKIDIPITKSNREIPIWRQITLLLRCKSTGQGFMANLGFCRNSMYILWNSLVPRAFPQAGPPFHMQQRGLPWGRSPDSMHMSWGDAGGVRVV